VSKKAIGILGGTFDPIHFGHLRLAEEMLELANLREIRFIPTGTPPHRDMPQVSAQHRSAMVQLAIADQLAFVLDPREVDRTTPLLHGGHVA
jgi:nicotinate-nucleotide adenylyltransferase